MFYMKKYNQLYDLYFVQNHIHIDNNLFTNNINMINNVNYPWFVFSLFNNDCIFSFSIVFELLISFNVLTW